MVRSSGGELFETFKEKGVVALGWADIGDISQLKSREEITAKIQEIWPDWKLRAAQVSAAQLYRFKNQVQIGDGVVTYDPSRRVYLTGKIKGDYVFDIGFVGEEFGNVRQVDWHERLVDRDSLSEKTKNSLGSTLSIFRLADGISDEIVAARDSPFAAPSANPAKIGNDAGADDSDVDLVLDVPAKAIELIKDKISGLTPYEAQDLIAGLLRAMGYRTQVSPPGPDRGIDIVASKDGLGFEAPRIIVQVKHRQNSVSAPEIREFIGGGLRHSDDRGLFVSKGGFTKDAKLEAERSDRPIQLMDLDLLVRSILQHYQSFDGEAQRLLPLKLVHWPVSNT